MYNSILTRMEAQFYIINMKNAYKGIVVRQELFYKLRAQKSNIVFIMTHRDIQSKRDIFYPYLT